MQSNNQFVSNSAVGSQIRFAHYVVLFNAVSIEGREKQIFRERDQKLAAARERRKAVRNAKKLSLVKKILL